MKVNCIWISVILSFLSHLSLATLRLDQLITAKYCARMLVVPLNRILCLNGPNYYYFGPIYLPNYLFSLLSWRDERQYKGQPDCLKKSGIRQIVHAYSSHPILFNPVISLQY